MNKIQLVLDNWEIITGLLLFAIQTLIRWRVIRDARVTKLYEEAVRYAEQWKKTQGKEKGIVPSNEEVLNMAIDYLEKRVPALHKIDLHRIMAIVNAMNAVRALTPASRTATTQQKT